MVSLPACSTFQLGSPQDATTINTPASWQATAKGRDATISKGWVSEFSDRDMKRAVDLAMTHNQDLAAATARMREAEYVRIAGRSRIKPNLNAAARGSYSISENGPLASRESESYGLTVAASWEVDLWGRLRNLNAADDADTAAARANFRSARLSLAASTSRAWCNLIAAEQQLDLGRRILSSFERNLRISVRNYKGTGQGSLDVQFGRTNVASAQRSLEARKQDREAAARTLELLTGKYPSGTSSAGAHLPRLKRSVPAGLPADLLGRRPDLAAAQARIYSTAMRADAARKSLLPSLSLTGNSGMPVSRFANFLDPNWLVTTVAANLAQNLYSGGALTQQAEAALERNQAAIHDYCQTALEAFQEVETALSADQSLALQETFLLKEVEQAKLAERQATRDYADGIEGSDILNVLESQRRANNAQASLIRLKNQRLQNRIDLHLALGGDFRTAES